jgi:hypothetical protein
MTQDQDGTHRELRFVFVQMLFALTVGEIARKFATLVDQVSIREAIPSYIHLFLVTIIVAASWAGWTRSIASRNIPPLLFVFSLPFLVLLLDVLLVIFYFIIVKGVEMPSVDTHVIVPSAKQETFWVLIIFIVYFFWDFFTKAVAPDTEPKPLRGFWQRLFAKEFWSRGGVTLICVGVALLI